MSVEKSFLESEETSTLTPESMVEESEDEEISPDVMQEEYEDNVVENENDSDNTSDEISTEASEYEGKSFNRKLTGYAPLSPDEEARLVKEYGDSRSPQAREQLILHNQRLVAYEAQKFKNFGVPYDDLIQEGNIGLMRAIDKFDYTTGNRLSTYAMWWIRQAMWRGIENQNRIIRVPVHMQSQMTKVKKYVEQYKTENGKEPSVLEIAAALNMDVDRVHFIQETQNYFSVASLSTPIGDDSDSTLEDIVPDDKQNTDVMLGDVQKQYLKEAFLHLSDKEVFVLTRRYGLDGNDPQTLEDVGHVLGVTRERVRQIQRKAERKLHRDKGLKELRKVLCE